MSHFKLMSAALCVAKLRNGDPCRSVATHNEFCAYHAALADALGNEVIANRGQTKQRNARQREPVIAESEPLALNPSTSKSPSAVRPALALTAAEEVEKIRTVLLDAATSTTRESWATCSAPSAGRDSGRRSPSPITAPGSRRSRHCSERDSVVLARQSSSSRGCRQRPTR